MSPPNSGLNNIPVVLLKECLGHLITYEGGCTFKQRNQTKLYEYLMPYNSLLYVLRTVFWSYNCLLMIVIIIIYFKLYKVVQKMTLQQKILEFYYPMFTWGVAVNKLMRNKTQNMFYLIAEPSGFIKCALNLERLIFKLSANKWLMLSWTVWNTTVWSLNCELLKDWCLIELFVIYRNTWRHLTLLTYAKLSCLKWNCLYI